LIIIELYAFIRYRLVALIVEFVKMDVMCHCLRNWLVSMCWISALLPITARRFNWVADHVRVGMRFCKVPVSGRAFGVTIKLSRWRAKTLGVDREVVRVAKGN